MLKYSVLEDIPNPKLSKEKVEKYLSLWRKKNFG